MRMVSTLSVRSIYVQTSKLTYLLYVDEDSYTARATGAGHIL